MNQKTNNAHGPTQQPLKPPTQQQIKAKPTSSTQPQSTPPPKPPAQPVAKPVAQPTTGARPVTNAGNKAQPTAQKTTKQIQKPPTGSVQSAEPSFGIESSKKRKKYSNSLFYGVAGVGKTTLAATASLLPSMQTVMYVNAEGGDESIIETYDYDNVNIGSFRVFARLMEYLQAHCKLRDMWVNQKDSEAKAKLIKYEAFFKGVTPEEIKEPTLYYTIIVDSLTEVQKYCMYQLLGVQIGKVALDVAPAPPEFAEWNRSAEMIRLLVRTLRDLPIHTIFITGCTEEQDEAKRFHYAPALPGKMANEILGFFDTVGFLTARMTEGGEILRRLWLEPGPNFKAKNRFRNFEGRYLDNPVMEDLIKYSLTK